MSSFHCVCVSLCVFEAGSSFHCVCVCVFEAGSLTECGFH